VAVAIRTLQRGKRKLTHRGNRRNAIKRVKQKPISYF